MVNKLFALASVSALSGLVAAAASTAGCSSTEVSSSFDSGRDALSERRGIGDNEEPVASTCMTTTLLNATTVPYKPALVQPGACSEKSLKALDDLVKASADGVAFSDLKTALQKDSASCASCVFGTDTGATWAPIVEKDGQVFQNLGGCVEVVSGNLACGKAWHQFDTCTNFGCKDCKSDGELDQCFKDVIGVDAPCGAAADLLRASCGTGLTTYLETCFPSDGLTIDGPIRYQCISGSPLDSGTTDSGTTDSGTTDSGTVADTGVKD